MAPTSKLPDTTRMPAVTITATLINALALCVSDWTKPCLSANLRRNHCNWVTCPPHVEDKLLPALNARTVSASRMAVPNKALFALDASVTSFVTELILEAPKIPPKNTSTIKASTTMAIGGTKRYSTNTNSNANGTSKTTVILAAL